MAPPIHPVDPRILFHHLAQAERHVAEGEKHIVRQEELVLDLERHRLDAKQARSVLTTMRDTQALYHQHRDLILRELAD